MATYATPPMPLRMNVWFRVFEVPSPAEPDLVDVPCSLSPMTPHDYFGAVLGVRVEAPATHIIRTVIIPEVVDNFLAGAPTFTWPTSMFEIPPDSGHYYLSVWSHQVGAGFPNHFQRIFVERFASGAPEDLPFFEGWI